MIDLLNNDLFFSLNQDILNNQTFGSSPCEEELIFSIKANCSL